jgi:hypothetical protein
MIKVSGVWFQVSGKRQNKLKRETKITVIVICWILEIFYWRVSY